MTTKIKPMVFKLWPYTACAREALLESWLNTLEKDSFILHESAITFYDVRDATAFKLKFGL